jgi:hypothetical protein
MSGIVSVDVVVHPTLSWAVNGRDCDQQTIAEIEVGNVIKIKAATNENDIGSSPRSRVGTP